MDRIREGSNGRGDLRAGDDCELSGSPARRCAKLVAHGSLTAAGSGEEVVPASDYRALQNQVRELHRLLGKKTLEAEILKEALEHATSSKKQLRLPPLPPKDDTR